MIITTRRCIVYKNHVNRSTVKDTVNTYSLCIGISCSAQPIISSGIAGFETYFAQMTIKTRQYVLCKNHVATSKAKFTVRTYSLCTGLNETYLFPAHNFVVGPASGMVRYTNQVFYPFVRSHQGAILLKALSGGISVLWTHFFYSHYYIHTIV